MLHRVVACVRVQGEMIDRIEYNVEQSVDYIETAKADTRTAVIYKKKSQRVRLYVSIRCCLVQTKHLYAVNLTDLCKVIDLF